MTSPARPDGVVLDASAAADLLAGTEHAAAVATWLARTELHVPAHFDAEVLSVLGRLHRAGQLQASDVDVGLDKLATMPARRHPLAELTGPAWKLRKNLRLVDALYVALAEQLDLLLVTTDHRLARAWPPRGIRARYELS